MSQDFTRCLVIQAWIGWQVSNRICFLSPINGNPRSNWICTGRIFSLFYICVSHCECAKHPVSDADHPFLNWFYATESTMEQIVSVNSGNFGSDQSSQSFLHEGQVSNFYRWNTRICRGYASYFDAASSSLVDTDDIVPFVKPSVTKSVFCPFILRSNCNGHIFLHKCLMNPMNTCDYLSNEAPRMVSFGATWINAFLACGLPVDADERHLSCKWYKRRFCAYTPNGNFLKPDKVWWSTTRLGSQEWLRVPKTKTTAFKTIYLCLLIQWVCDVLHEDENVMWIMHSWCQEAKC